MRFACQDAKSYPRSTSRTAARSHFRRSGGPSDQFICPEWSSPLPPPPVRSGRPSISLSPRPHFFILVSRSVTPPWSRLLFPLLLSLQIVSPRSRFNNCFVTLRLCALHRTPLSDRVSYRSDAQICTRLMCVCARAPSLLSVFKAKTLRRGEG